MSITPALGSLGQRIGMHDSGGGVYRAEGALTVRRRKERVPNIWEPYQLSPT